MWAWLQQHPQELLGKGIDFPLQRVHRGLLPLKWPICFWILHLSGQLHRYFPVSKLCSMDFAHMWCCGSIAHWHCFLHHLRDKGMSRGSTLSPRWLTAMLLPHLAPKETQTQPWQALCKRHTGGMGIHPACVEHCLGITACCHANGLAFLDRNSLALEVSKCGCTVVCNPQPKPSQFLHSTQAAYKAYSHTILSSRGTALSGILPVMAVWGQRCQGCRGQDTKQRQREGDM